MSPAGKRRFITAAGTGMPPTADESVGVTTSGRQDVTRSVAGPGSRIAYTWRLTADQALTMDDLMLRLKRELGRGKLDKAEMLAALVGLAAGNPAIFGALVAQLQVDVTS
jgi:hypothetical protein